MNPLAMTLLLAVSLLFFAYTARRRCKLMLVAARPDPRLDQVSLRVQGVLEYVLGQKRMFRYRLAGVAHALIFGGFAVLLLNSIMLWGRGYDPHFSLWILSPGQPLGAIYWFLADLFAVAVLSGVAVFIYYRVVGRLKRLTLNTEGVVILGIIATMMLSHLIYTGAEILRDSDHRRTFAGYAPFSSLFAGILAQAASVRTVDVWWQVTFWMHAALVLLFLNLLPYGKHFHVLTVLPNVLARSLTPRGRLAPITDIDGKLERSETLGAKQIQDFSWKSVLDLYTCTECGRCSDHCPATKTGKLLSPKHLTIALRDHLYEREAELVELSPARAAQDESLRPLLYKDLVPDAVNPETLWACTTCGACEQECPVFITYIDKIVDLRRNLVMERGEFPGQLQNAFRGLETVGNPYSFANEQRADWAAGLDIPLLAEKPDAEVLYWVGCSPSFDDRARKIARATATLMKQAGVNFAILGPQEQCTGDPARRAGNEYLFQMLAQANVETLTSMNVRKLVTTCPHCFNTHKNEYPDFGAKYEVVHHTVFLAELVRSGRLRPTQPVDATVVYHDACYLGRHNQVYDAPREVLRSVPGVRLVEAPESRDRGMCCGAGGAQMWKEEEHSTGPNASKVNHARTSQLLRVLPTNGAGKVVASSCPFCMTMLTDGLRDKGHADVQQLDIAEVLLRSVAPQA